MNDRKIAWLVAVGMVFGAACGLRGSSKGIVRLDIRWAYHKWVYLETVPFAGEKDSVLDSAYVDKGYDTLSFDLPRSPMRLFRFRITDAGRQIVFINDSPEVELAYTYLGDYKVLRSPATRSVKDFLDGQTALAGETRYLKRRLDTLQAEQAAPARLDTAEAVLNRALAHFFGRYVDFADTVGNPAAFIYVADMVDFGPDYRAYKAFMERAAARFPGYGPIRDLLKATLAYASIYEQEYRVGDTLPVIELPDTGGLPFSTASLSGRFFLLDFWSTWCNSCAAYNVQKKQLRALYPDARLGMVSVALDDHVAAWKRQVAVQDLNWEQLIDVQMWRGPAVMALKFDSIPFNFLVGPDRRVVAKAIPADSLIPVIARTLRGAR